jgi:PTH1 family peptidyl-tRNA hydrolase
MRLIVGLGNPGFKYEKTRHNVGFDFLNYLALELAGEQVEWKKSEKFQAEICELSFSGEKLLLAKPLTFMNLSGRAVLALKNFYKLSNSQILVVFDDIDLPLGKIRHKKSGSAGTHNGMKSIISAISDDFARLKIGVENRSEAQKKVITLSDYVLSKFLDNEWQVILELLPRCISTVKSDFL